MSITFKTTKERDTGKILQVLVFADNSDETLLGAIKPNADIRAWSYTPVTHRTTNLGLVAIYKLAQRIDKLNRSDDK